MLRSIGLTQTHMECRYLKDSVPVLTDLLAFEKVGERPGEATLKHPNKIGRASCRERVCQYV